MTRNLRRNLVIMAVEAIKSYAGPNASRETAGELLPLWQWLVPLGGEEPGLAAEILTHFELAEPVMVPTVDYLPPLCDGTVFELALDRSWPESPCGKGHNHVGSCAVAA